MTKRWIWSTSLVMVLGMGWILLIPGNADAQRRGGGRRGGDGNRNYRYVQPYYGYNAYPGYYGGYRNRSYRGDYWYDSDDYPPNQSNQSFYPPEDGSRGSRAHIQVLVPSSAAQVWFNNHQTRQQGTERDFDSPPLEGGYTYSYSVRVRWQQDGQTRDQKRTVWVSPGQTVTVDFNQ